jgi:hypothetical protein
MPEKNGRIGVILLISYQADMEIKRTETKAIHANHMNGCIFSSYCNAF